MKLSQLIKKVEKDGLSKNEFFQGKDLKTSYSDGTVTSIRGTKLFFKNKSGVINSVPISKVDVIPRSAAFKKDYASRIPFGGAGSKYNQASFYLKA